MQERKIERVGGGASLIPIDVRVIAATNRDLQTEIAAKNFREDLFYRLNVISIRLPPLRERLADIGQLAEYFLERAAQKHNLPPKTLAGAAVRGLMNREFAGNVRELENIIERAVIAAGFSNSILPEHFSIETGNNSPPKPPNQIFLNLPFKEAVAALERALIENALRESEGNRSEAARKLGINRRLLYDKIEEHKITNES